MDIVQGQTQFQDTFFVIGEFSQGPYRALRKLDAQVAELTRTAPREDDPRYIEVKKRLDNYAELRIRIIASRPSEYWDAGFEAAEEEYWINHLARKVAIEVMVSGRPAASTMEAVLALPEQARQSAIAKSKTEVSALRSLGMDQLYLGVSGE